MFMFNYQLSIISAPAGRGRPFPGRCIYVYVQLSIINYWQLRRLHPSSWTGVIIVYVYVLLSIIKYAIFMFMFYVQLSIIKYLSLEDLAGPWSQASMSYLCLCFMFNYELSIIREGESGGS